METVYCLTALLCVVVLGHFIESGLLNVCYALREIAKNIKEK
jgi:hypothetical protein